VGFGFNVDDISSSATRAQIALNALNRSELGGVDLKATTRTLEMATTGRIQLLDITRPVEQIVRDSGIKSGLCLVHAPHATVAIIANENEQGLVRDFVDKIEELYPPRGNYLHNRIDDNASSHLASGLIGSSRTFPVRDGRLVRGTWQNIFLVELDGPRTQRLVEVTVIGE